MIWYKFYLGDYITHTAYLSDAEDLAYRRLLDFYYISEKEIPLDTESVARKIRLDLDVTESVLNEFFDKTENGYFHSRCDSEIRKYQHQVATNRDLGKRGGRPKKTESVTETKPNINPNRNRNRINTITSVAPTRFDEFWDNWPTSKRKVAKNACKAKWMHLALDPLTDEINASVTRLKASEQWLTGFDPAPLTYLNQKRWEDGGETDSLSIGRRAI